MAGRRRTILTPQQGALAVEDYRRTSASRLNNPPATVPPVAARVEVGRQYALTD